MTEPEKISHTVAILVHDQTEVIGLIALSVRASSTLMGAWNKGELEHYAMQTPELGRDRFQKSIANSVANGFRVGFLGKPNNAELS